MDAVVRSRSGTRSRPVARAAVVVIAMAALAFFCWTSSAHALSITEAGYTVPVAYELKSLQVTHFYCQVDTPGVWATLRIKDGQGRVVRTIYDGPIQAANTRFWFPGWNGMDNNGQRLFSASWNWELKVTKGGVTSTKTGKITVSKIQFFITGRVGSHFDDYYSRYMIPGNANVYIRTSSRAWVDLLTLEIEDTRGNYWYAMWDVDDRATRNITSYIRGRDAIVERGMHDFYVGGANDVYYYITVIQ